MASLFVETQASLGLKGGLLDFVRLAWPIVEPGTPFCEGWHIEEVCKHLEATYEGKVRKLVINVPPGHMKSLLTCVFFPLWCWIRNPGLRFIYASFDADLTLRQARQILEVMASPWFKARWGHIVQVEDGVAASDFKNSRGGFRLSTSIRGKATGRHADFLIVDDPIKPAEVTRDALKKAIQWYRGTFSSRRRNPKTTRQIVIMQRLHEDDLAGFCIAQGYEHLNLPARYEAENPSRTSVGGDRRTVEGQLLWPEHVPEAALKEIETDLGPNNVAAQLQQRPSPDGGAVFSKEWWRSWTNLPGHLHLVISVDCTFKDSDGTDYVVIQVWGKSGPNYYLLHEVRDRMDFPRTCVEVLKVRQQYSKCTTVLIEDKANGPAVVSTLSKKVPGVISVPPKGSKEARASAVAPFFASGNVFHPPAETTPWLESHRQELQDFPTGRFDDRVDACSQALIYLHAKGYNLGLAMKNLSPEKMRRILGAA